MAAFLNLQIHEIVVKIYKELSNTRSNIVFDRSLTPLLGPKKSRDLIINFQKYSNFLNFIENFSIFYIKWTRRFLEKATNIYFKGSIPLSGNPFNWMVKSLILVKNHENYILHTLKSKKFVIIFHIIFFEIQETEDSLLCSFYVT